MRTAFREHTNPTRSCKYLWKKDNGSDEERRCGCDQNSRGAKIFDLGDVRIGVALDHVTEFLKRSVECFGRKYESDEDDYDEPFHRRNAKKPSKPKREQSTDDIDPEINFLSPCDHYAFERVADTDNHFLAFRDRK